MRVRADAKVEPNGQPLPPRQRQDAATNWSTLAAGTFARALKQAWRALMGCHGQVAAGPRERVHRTRPTGPSPAA